jgi:type I restriction enzyme, S subunit
MSELPNGWAQVKFGDIIELAYGKGLPKDARNSAGKHPVYGSNGIVGYHDSFLIKGPAIIVGRKGGAGIATFAKDDCWPIDTTYYVIPKEAYDLKFAYYLIISLRLNQFDRSTAIPGLNRDDAYVLDIQLPPLNEQKRIVAKIEELFSELDSGIESLKTAHEQLKVYRQAVLKHAFEGKLTAAWREKNKDKLESADQLLARIKHEREDHYLQELKEYSIALKQWEKDKSLNKPPKPKKFQELIDFSSDELSALPRHGSEQWKWVKLDKICAHKKHAIKAGPFGSALKKEFYVPDGYKIYGQEQVIAGDAEYGDYYIGEEKYKELESCKVKPHDVLISLVGTVGRVLILPESAKPGIINPRLVKISLNTKHYLPEFFKYFFESALVKSLYKFLAKGTTMDVLNVGIIESLPFPLCSIEEQRILITEVEARLSVVEKIEQEIEDNLQKSEALRQSILKKAFSGQLVAQDPADEPASLLLERIRSEKATPKPTAKKPKEKRRAE